MSNKSVSSVMGKKKGIEAPEYKVSAARKVDTFVRTSPQQMQTNDKNNQISDAINSAIGVVGKVSEREREDQKNLNWQNRDALVAKVDAERALNRKNGVKADVVDLDSYKGLSENLQLYYSQERANKIVAENMLEINKKLQADPSIQTSSDRMNALFYGDGGDNKGYKADVGADVTDPFQLNRNLYINSELDKHFETAQDAALVHVGKVHDALGNENLLNRIQKTYDEGKNLSLEEILGWGEEDPMIQRLINKEGGEIAVRNMLSLIHI